METRRNRTHRIYGMAVLASMLFFPMFAYGRNEQSYLPVVELEFSALSRDTFSNAHIRVIGQKDTISMAASVRHRGGSTTRYQKQSYAIKLKDENGLKTDTSFLGLRRDNYWILNAMAPDKARMRNRVAMDLWLDFSAKPSYVEQEPAMQNGSNGQFVEVYVNGDYRGIYNLMERVDRKQLKLKKAKGDEIRGVLYKSVSWAGGIFEDPEPYDNTSGVWTSYEYQYPDVEDSLITWEPLYNAFYFTSHSDTETFRTEVATRYEIPVFTDYYLLAAILSARDNMGKNIYMSYYNIQTDSKLCPTPWDMDHSFGRQYNGTIEPPETEIPKWGRNLYNRMIEEVPGYNATLLNRYAELRRGAFRNDSLKARFDYYFELFQTSGADLREEARWGGIDNIDLDFLYEQDYISQWLDERLAYTDSVFSYSKEGAIKATSLSEGNFPYKRIENGHIYIYNNNSKYNLVGLKIK